MQRRSEHILGTSANLLGFTFIVLTSIKALGLSRHSLLIDMTGTCVVLYALSSLISFLSMRATTEARQKRYEGVADIIFIVALILCMLLSVLLVLDVVRF